MKLYIIGNGFDRAHDLPTNFKHFIDSKESYKEKYEIFKGNNWNNIENNIAKLILNKKQEIEDYIDSLDADEITSEIISSFGHDKYGFIDYHGYEEEHIKDLINELQEITSLILDFEIDFKDYLQKNINYEIDKIDKYSKLDFNNSVVISFNYTYTLEKVYNVKNVHHIHGKLSDEIKIGFNSDVSKFDINVGNLNYPSFDEIIVESKHDLIERQIRYDDMLDENYNPTGEVYENPERLRFHNEVKKDITEKKEQIEGKIKLNDKSLFQKRLEIIDEIKDLSFKEAIIIGHSLGEMDHDFFDLIFGRDMKITCGYFDSKDLKNKKIISEIKGWNITFNKHC